MDDLEFVRRCIKKEKGAWDEFIERYSRLIYNYIHKTLAAKNYHALENDTRDIYQELFSSLIKDNFRKLSTFKARNGCSLASWLRQVSINFTLDYLRRLKTTAVSIDEEDEEGFSLKDILKDNSASSPEILFSKERARSLKDCIRRLNTGDKYFIEMHINRGIRLEELRKLLRLSRSAVDMRKARILGRLKDCFRRKGFVLDF